MVTTFAATKASCDSNWEIRRGPQFGELANLDFANSYQPSKLVQMGDNRFQAFEEDEDDDDNLKGGGYSAHGHAMIVPAQANLPRPTSNASTQPLRMPELGLVNASTSSAAISSLSSASKDVFASAATMQPSPQQDAWRALGMRASSSAVVGASSADAYARSNSKHASAVRSSSNTSAAHRSQAALFERLSWALHVIDPSDLRDIVETVRGEHADIRGGDHDHAALTSSSRGAAGDVDAADTSDATTPDEQMSALDFESLVVATFTDIYGHEMFSSCCTFNNDGSDRPAEVRQALESGWITVAMEVDEALRRGEQQTQLDSIKRQWEEAAARMVEDDAIMARWMVEEEEAEAELQRRAREGAGGRADDQFQVMSDDGHDGDADAALIEQEEADAQMAAALQSELDAAHAADLEAGERQKRQQQQRQHQQHQVHGRPSISAAPNAWDMSRPQFGFKWKGAGAAAVSSTRAAGGGSVIAVVSPAASGSQSVSGQSPSAAAVSTPSWIATGVRPRLSAAAIGLCRSTDCTCDGADSGRTMDPFDPRSQSRPHTKACLQNCYHSMEEDMAWLREKQQTKRMQAKEMHRRGGVYASAAHAYVQEAQQIGARIQAAQEVKSHAMLLIHNPGIAALARPISGSDGSAWLGINPIAAAGGNGSAAAAPSQYPSLHPRSRDEAAAAAPTHTIDLHGQPVREAIALCRAMLAVAGLDQIWSIEFVTGRGKHSENRAKLKTHVGSLLRTMIGKDARTANVDDDGFVDVRSSSGGSSSDPGAWYVLDVSQTSGEGGYLVRLGPKGRR